MLTGLAMCFTGYRIFKVLIFLSGFYLGYWLCYSIMTGIDVDYGSSEDIIIFCSCIGAGILFGLALLYLVTVGIFVLGGLAGFFMAWWILSFIESSSPIHEPLYTWIFVVGLVTGARERARRSRRRR